MRWLPATPPEMALTGNMKEGYDCLEAMEGLQAMAGERI